MKLVLILCCLAMAVNAQTAEQRIVAFEHQLKTAPANTKAQAGLASAYIQKLRETTDFAYLNRAGAIVDQMLAANPANYEALRLSAEIETHRHNFPKAAELALRLTARNPSDSGALGLLGDSQMEMAQYDAAGETYMRMLTIAPNLTSFNRMAYHRFVTGKTEEALAWMNTAIQSGSRIPENLAWCLVEFGDMLFKTGHIKDAQAAYEQALATLPGYHKAYAALGRKYAATGDFQKALDSFQTAQSVIPLPDYAQALEAIYAKLGKPEQAAKQRSLIDVIDKLGRVNGEKGNRLLALVYADENRNLDRAEELIRGELETRKDVYTRDALAWVLFRSGKLKEAQEAIDVALAMQTPEPMFLYHAGKIAAAAGNDSAARVLFNQALALNPNFAFPQADDAKSYLGQAGATR